MPKPPRAKLVGRQSCFTLLALLITATLATLGGLAVAPNADASARERTVKVLSYNMHAGIGLDGKLNLERVATDIINAEADVIGLQEVDNHYGKRSEFVDQAQWLADRLDMNVAFGANIDNPPVAGQTHRQQYGIATLSRHRIIRSSHTRLTSIEYPTKPTEPRGLLTTTINVGGVTIDVHNTHYDHQRAEQRHLHVDETLAKLSTSHRPALLVGDLNAEPDAAEVQRLTAVLDDAFADVENGNTFPAEAPIKRIDYILGRDVRFANPQVINSSGSDHLPLSVDVTFGG